MNISILTSKSKIMCIFAIAAALLSIELFGQDPVRYVGMDKISNSDYKTGYHDGQMRPALGVHNYQILRANRTNPEWSDGLGWTYNHAPMLAYWNNYFWCQYLTNPTGEHIPPGVTMLAKSKNGKDWEKPVVIFPIYFTANEDASINFTFMHQRMGFYVAPNGRFLTFGFYGPNDGHGIGRVVREIHQDHSLGPVCFIRVNDNWQGEVKYPLYTASEDTGFVNACNAFLGDKIRRIQWWEEDFLAKDADDFYRVPMIVEDEKPEPGKGFCFYKQKDGTVVGFFKGRRVTLSRDNGETWTDPHYCETLAYEGAKVWAQKMDNDRYALVYNPTGGLARHPLSIATGTDGIEFNHLLNVHSEVPLKRFWGREKRPGPQYVRGIIPGNGNPPGDDLWVVYSVNKEDIWISCIPMPVTGEVFSNITDDFNQMTPGGVVQNWNIYSPRWCPITIIRSPDSDENCLMLKDFDPYDYARAVRVFHKTYKLHISFDLYIEKNSEVLDIEIVAGNGARLIQTRIDTARRFLIKGLNSELSIQTQTWISFEFDVDATKKQFTIQVNGKDKTKTLPFTDEGVPERIVFRTGDYRLADDVQEYKSGNDFIPGWDEPGADEPVEAAVFYIRNFRAE